MKIEKFLKSKGLYYTRELINIADETINLPEIMKEYAKLYHEAELKKLRVTDVSGMLKSFVSYAESRSISDININDDTIEYFIEDFNLH